MRLPVILNDDHLDDHRRGFDHEDAAHDEHHEFLPDDHGDRAERGAQRECADVAHEHLRRIGVEPQEAEPRAHQRGAEDQQLTCEPGTAGIARYCTKLALPLA